MNNDTERLSPPKGGRGVIILGIESSCDDTSAAVIRDGILLSNVTASQAVHMEYGGVVPELASRAHQQNIVPVVDTALKKAVAQTVIGRDTACYCHLVYFQVLGSQPEFLHKNVHDGLLKGGSKVISWHISFIPRMMITSLPLFPSFACW